MASAHLRKPLLFAIAAALLTLGLKSGAYFATGSVSLLSDALESLVNLSAAVLASVFLWFAHRPVDSNHTYGHEKIEYFSSGLEGSLILVAALAIGWYAIQRLVDPVPLEALALGGILSLVASILNAAVGFYMLKVGREHRSIALEAGGKHLLSDVLTSTGVIAGLGLVRITGWQPLDPLMALGVAGLILFTAFDLIRRSFNGLTDHALPESEQAQVRNAIENLIEPGMHYHALRTRQAGARRFVDFHLLVPGDWSVQEAHARGEKIEAALEAVFPSIQTTVHIEPVEEQNSWQDSELLKFENKARG